MTHNNHTRPTWNDALAIAKELQEEYQIPIFAMTYRGGACRCCPSVAQFNPEAYLTEDIAHRELKESDFFIIFGHTTYNAYGEAVFADKKGNPLPFGSTSGGFRSGKDIWIKPEHYVRYRLSDTFTMDTLNEVLTKFTDRLNAKAEMNYAYTAPVDKDTCALIEYVGLDPHQFW